MFEEKELDKHCAVRSCQAGGSGEGEWSRRVALHEACMGVQVHTGTTAGPGRTKSNLIPSEFCIKNSNFQSEARCASLRELGTRTMRTVICSCYGVSLHAQWPKSSAQSCKLSNATKKKEIARNFLVVVLVGIVRRPSCSSFFIVVKESRFLSLLGFSCW